MCGIFALLNNRDTYSEQAVKTAFKKGARRGPESSTLQRVGHEIELGFHRLAINGLTSLSDQPITIDNITVICNGEIYNYKALFNMLDITPTTESDCEIIIHLYLKYGIQETLALLDGVFAFALYDFSKKYDTQTLVHVARDPHGVRPLYILSPSGPRFEDREMNNISIMHDNIYAFASELKVLQSLINETGPLYYDSFQPTSLTIAQGFPSPPSKRGLLKVKQFRPGTYSTYHLTNLLEWKEINKMMPYTSLNISSLSLKDTKETIGQSSYELMVWDSLCDAVRKRVVGTTDRPVACCLSGGLDSSLIAALVSQYYNGKLETYSIGMEGSEDLRMARLVAGHIKSNHTEILLTEEQFWDAIPEVIESIESYDTTTVRASVGNYLLGKYISEHSEAKVIFNGDGSDEVAGGYLYLLKAPDSLEFNAECRRLLKDIHAFDVLRSDKSISSHGLEPRTPFLDKSFVSTYLNMPVSLRNPRHNSGTQPEKYFIRSIVQKMFPTLLPVQVLWRPKEAFSDGVSGNGGSWYKIIERNMKDIEVVNPTLEPEINFPTTPEQQYYRMIFDEKYPGSASLVPYFWMPKYVNAKDSSARSLEIYDTETASKSILEELQTSAMQ